MLLEGRRKAAEIRAALQVHDDGLPTLNRLAGVIDGVNHGEMKLRLNLVCLTSGTIPDAVTGDVVLNTK